MEGDCEHTEGIYRYDSGAVYRGEWQDGKPDGVGTYEFQNGDVYDGQWHAGDMHGEGTFRFGEAPQLHIDDLSLIGDGINNNNASTIQAHHSGSRGDVYQGQFQVV